MKKAIAFITVLSLLFTLCACSGTDYKNANALLDSGDLEAAQSAFEVLGDYKDSAEKAKLCRFRLAEGLMAEDRYEEAAEAFEALGDFEESASRAKRCRYCLAEGLMAENRYEEAAEAFDALGDFEDSVDKAKSCRYEAADLLLFQLNYDEAMALFTGLGDYRDSDERAEECLFRKASAEADALYAEMMKIDAPVDNYRNSLRQVINKLDWCNTVGDLYRVFGNDIDINDTTMGRALDTYKKDSDDPVEGCKHFGYGTGQAYYLLTYGMTESEFNAVMSTEQRNQALNTYIKLEVDGPGALVAMAQKGKHGLFLFYSVVYCYNDSLIQARENFPLLQEKILAFVEKYPDYPLNESFQSFCTTYSVLLEKIDDYGETFDDYYSQLKGYWDNKPFEELLHPPIHGNRYTCTDLAILDGEQTNISMSNTEMSSLVEKRDRIWLVIDDSYQAIQLKYGYNTACTARIKAEKDGAEYHGLVIWDELPEFIEGCTVTATDLTFRVDNGQVKMTLALDGDSDKLRFDPNMKAKYYIELKFEYGG